MGLLPSVSHDFGNIRAFFPSTKTSQTRRRKSILYTHTRHRSCRVVIFVTFAGKREGGGAGVSSFPLYSSPSNAGGIHPHNAYRTQEASLNSLVHQLIANHSLGTRSSRPHSSKLFLKQILISVHRSKSARLPRAIPTTDVLGQVQHEPYSLAERLDPVVALRRPRPPTFPVIRLTPIPTLEPTSSVFPPPKIIPNRTNLTPYPNSHEHPSLVAIVPASLRPLLSKSLSRPHCGQKRQKHKMSHKKIG